MRDLRVESKKFEQQLSLIKVFMVDVDGVLTDGRLLWMGESVGWNRFFNAWDGYGLKLLMKAGIKVGVISGGDSIGLEKRIENLNLDFGYMGNEDKRQAYNDVKKKYQVKDENILYMGDEFFDLPLLKQAGFSATVPQASLEIQELVHYVTARDAGKGAVREVIDMVRYAQNIIPEELKN